MATANEASGLGNNYWLVALFILKYIVWAFVAVRYTVVAPFGYTAHQEK